MALTEEAQLTLECLCLGCGIHAVHFVNKYYYCFIA